MNNMNKLVKAFMICMLVALFSLANNNMYAQNKRVFHGNHFEYCCQDADGYFSDCDDPDYSMPYTITISNTEIVVSERKRDGGINEFKFRIIGKKFCAPDNVWYFDVKDEDGDDDIVGVSRDGDFLMLFDYDGYDICAMVYYMRED